MLFVRPFSSDVKSLFTSIPLELAIESVKESLANYSDELPIPKEEVIDLLILCLQSTFFQYDGNFYQQLLMARPWVLQSQLS